MPIDLIEVIIMSKYKKIMLDRDIMQKEVLSAVRQADDRIDKSLLSKIVNDICLPTPQVLAAICNTLSCTVNDLYEPCEIALVPDTSARSTACTDGRHARPKSKQYYKVTATIPSNIAHSVLTQDVLQAMGYNSVSDFIRRAVAWLYEEWEKTEQHAGATPPQTTIK